MKTTNKIGLIAIVSALLMSMVLLSSCQSKIDIAEQMYEDYCNDNSLHNVDKLNAFTEYCEALRIEDLQKLKQRILERNQRFEELKRKQAAKNRVIKEILEGKEFTLK